MCWHLRYTQAKVYWRQWKVSSERTWQRVSVAYSRKECFFNGETELGARQRKQEGSCGRRLVDDPRYDGENQVMIGSRRAAVC